MDETHPNVPLVTPVPPAALPWSRKGNDVAKHEAEYEEKFNNPFQVSTGGSNSTCSRGDVCIELRRGSGLWSSCPLNFQ